MSLLDDLPVVSTFFGISGISLKTASIIIATLAIAHPMTYSCSFLLPLSYLLVTIWMLVALYFVLSIALFVGLLKGDALLCAIWIWYALVFVSLMLLMMMLLVCVFTSRKYSGRVLIVIFGILWYLLTVYFIIVVNSHRKELEKSALRLAEKITSKKQL